MMGELCLLSPLLEGEDAGDQLAIIVDMLGAPSEEDIESMKVEDHILASAMRVMEVRADSPLPLLHVNFSDGEFQWKDPVPADELRRDLSSGDVSTEIQPGVQSHGGQSPAGPFTLLSSGVIDNKRTV